MELIINGEKQRGTTPANAFNNYFVGLVDSNHSAGSQNIC